MPTLNKSARPAGPRPAIPPGLVATTASKTISMFNWELASLQSSLRCLQSRRRRHGVETIADIFIQSLVLAGFCSDHSPQNHIFTAPKTTSKKSYVEFSSFVRNNHQNNIERNFVRQRTFTPFRTSSHSRPMSTHAATAPPKMNNGSEESPEDDTVSHPNTRFGPNITTRIENKKAEVREGETGPHAVVASKGKPFPYVSQRSEKIIISELSNMRTNKKNTFSTTLLHSSSSITEYMKKARTDTSDILSSLKDMVNASNSDKRKKSSDLTEFLAALDDKTKSNRFVFSLYNKLPPPGVLFLSKSERGRLLRRFAQPLDRRRSNARYYLYLVQDMIDADLPISRSLWTSAIYFCAHKVLVLHKRDLIDALAIWRRMENIHGIQSDSVVFELLFTIAVKTGYFAVADRLMAEMAARGIRHTRRGMVSQIYYSGRKSDVDGIHKAFEDFVRSGEVVDTAVLNCLFSSLLQAGELETAERIYAKMIQEHKRVVSASKEHQSAILPSLHADFGTWRGNSKRLGLVFERYASLRKKYREHSKQLQDIVPMTPDTKTFSILFGHHCIVTGDLKAVCGVIRDMEQIFPIPPRSFIYYFLFQGFSRHGQAKGWTKERLLEVWETFKRVLFESYTRLERLENDRTPLKPRWENPLKSVSEVLLDDPINDGVEIPNKPIDSGPSEDQSGRVVANDPLQDEEDLLRMFDNVGHYRWSSRLEEAIPRRPENAVFLGRSLNILILKAFGAHADTEDLLRVFSQIERIWKPRIRLAADAQAVKNEFQKQLLKTQKKRRK